MKATRQCQSGSLPLLVSKAPAILSWCCHTSCAFEIQPAAHKVVGLLLKARADHQGKHSRGSLELWSWFQLCLASFFIRTSSTTTSDFLFIWLDYLWRICLGTTFEKGASEVKYSVKIWLTRTSNNIWAARKEVISGCVPQVGDSASKREFWSRSAAFTNNQAKREAFRLGVLSGDHICAAAHLNYLPKLEYHSFLDPLLDWNCVQLTDVFH